MRKRILLHAGLMNTVQTAVYDTDRLWERYGCDEAAEERGYTVRHFDDPAALRGYYETECRPDPRRRQALVIDRAAFALPEDIRKRVPVHDVGLHRIFPTLNGEALREMPGLDYEHLAAVMDCLPYRIMDKSRTLDFCLRDIHAPFYAVEFAFQMLEEAVSRAEKAAVFRDWIPAAKAYGKALMVQHSGVKAFEYFPYLPRIGEAFERWLRENGAADPGRPDLSGEVAGAVREDGGKAALIMMDGLTFEHYYALRKQMVREPFSYAEGGLSASALPPENTEARWRACWEGQGFRGEEIAFTGEETPEIPGRAKIAGIAAGRPENPEEEAVRLARLVRELLEREFTVYLSPGAGNPRAGTALEETVVPFVRIGRFPPPPGKWRME